MADISKVKAQGSIYGLEDTVARTSAVVVTSKADGTVELQTPTSTVTVPSLTNFGDPSELENDVVTEISDLKSQIEQAKNGIETFELYATFVNGTLSHGNLDTAYKFRVATNTIMSFSRNILVNIADGFKLGVQTFDSNDEFVSDSGWHTGSYLIGEGTKFKVVIARITENNSEIANISEFVDSVTFNTNVYEQIQETQIKVLELEEGLFRSDNGEDIFTLGNITLTSGNNNTSSKAVRINGYLPNNLNIIRSSKIGSSFKLFLYAYDENDNYVGHSIGNGTELSNGTEEGTPSYEYDLNVFRKAHPSYKWRFSGFSVPWRDVTLAEAYECFTLVYANYALQKDLASVESKMEKLSTYATDSDVLALIEEVNNTVTYDYADTIHIGWITDIHAGGDGNNKPIDYCSELTKYGQISAYMITGDLNHYVNERTLEGTQIMMSDVARHISEMLLYCQPLPCRGNHDGINGSTSYTSTMFNNALLKPFIDNYGSDGQYYFDAKNKIRIIMLNSCMDSQSRKGFSLAQVDWLSETLAATPAGYGVIVAAHHPINADFAGSTPNDNLPSYYVDVVTTIQNFKQTRTDCDFIAYLFGHMHTDQLGVKDGFVQCSLIDSSTDNSDFSTDVLCIDTTNKTVHLVRLGEGSDRTFGYGSNNLG